MKRRALSQCVPAGPWSGLHTDTAGPVRISSYGLRLGFYTAGPVRASIRQIVKTLYGEPNAGFHTAGPWPQSERWALAGPQSVDSGQAFIRRAPAGLQYGWLQLGFHMASAAELRNSEPRQSRALYGGTRQAGFHTAGSSWTFRRRTPAEV